jgi:hypothetical protein
VLGYRVSQKEKQKKLEHNSSGITMGILLCGRKKGREERKREEKRVRGLLMASAQKRKGPAGSPELSGPVDP